MKKNLVFIDIDGVLADNYHRLEYMLDKDYQNFYSADNILADKKLEKGCALLDALYVYHSYHADVIYITGRPERTRTSTVAWMSMHHIAPMPTWDSMIMREDGDHRNSCELKPIQICEWLVRWYKGKFNPSERAMNRIVNKDGQVMLDALFEEYENVFFIDDDPTNVKMVERTFPGFICLCFGAERIA